MTENNSSRPPADPRPPRGAAFFEQVRRQGFVRSADDRWLGGVCRSIADRTGYDVTLVRGVTFVLTLFFGFGILLYGLAWAFLPEPDGRIHAQEVLHGRWSAGLVGAGIFTLMGLGNPGFHGPLWLFWPWGDWSFWGWFGPLLGVGLIAWIIYAVVTNKRKGQIPPADQRGFGPGPQQPGGPQGFGNGGPGGFGGSQGPAGPASPAAPVGAPGADSPAAPSSDPADPSAPADDDIAHSFTGPTSGPDTSSTTEPGAAPPTLPLASTAPAYQAQSSYQTQSFADVPRYAGSYRGGPQAPKAPARRPAPAPRRTRARSAGAPIVLLFSGLALLALVGVWALDRSMELPGHAPLIAIGGAIGILGLGILVAGFKGRRGGALTFWSWVAVAAALVATAVTGVGEVTAVQDATWAPASVVAAEEGYSVGVGTTTVDLSGLNPETRIEVPVNSGIGDVHLMLPPNVPTEVQFSGGVRDGDRPGADGTNFDDSNFLVNNTKRYGVGDPLIVVSVRIGVGDLTVDGVEQGANR